MFDSTTSTINQNSNKVNIITVQRDQDNYYAVLPSITQYETKLVRQRHHGPKKWRVSYCPQTNTPKIKLTAEQAKSICFSNRESAYEPVLRSEKQWYITFKQPVAI